MSVIPASEPPVGLVEVPVAVPPPDGPQHAGGLVLQPQDLEIW